MRMDLLVTVIVSVFASTGFWTLINAIYQKKTETKSAGDKLLLGLAFKAIVEVCQHHLAVGYISADEYMELNKYLYEPYKELDGDGTATRLMREVEKLPLREG